MYLLLAIGLACDTSEAILALCWGKKSPPQIVGKVRREKTAISMTVCDDLSYDHLNSLRPLAEVGYDVYVLDDSELPITIPNSLYDKVTIVRRSSRKGWKAGNLNNWLFRHGTKYEYVLVLDADSLISVNSADKMLLTAEHPENAKVAIFQSKIRPKSFNPSFFSKIMGSGALPRMRIIERVHAPLQLLLSFGHNQLLRLQPIRSLGGFDETLTCEDTSLSLSLAASGWESKLVDVWSYDTDPVSPSAYVRRTTRWARQTVEVFQRPWLNVPLRIKLLLCRHLLSYLLPIIGTCLLVISLWNGPSSPTDTIDFMLKSLAMTKGYRLYAMSLLPSIAILILFIFLRIILALQEGVSCSRLFVTFLLGSAPYSILLFPLATSMIASCFGYRAQFIPTNSKISMNRDNNFVNIVQRTFVLFVLVGLLAFMILNRPGCLFVGFNFVWIGYIFLSPISLFLIAVIDWSPLTSEKRRA